MNKLFNFFLSPQIKSKVERSILVIAIASYVIHLLIILLNKQGLLGLEQNFFKNPIAAIYTPFSFILLYEVYLLIFFLPKSITFYIGKQYEIITLIVIRRIFKDIAYLELNQDWFKDKNDLQFTFDVLTTTLLFFIIFLFYRSIKRRPNDDKKASLEQQRKIQKFINLKKSLATLLVPVLIFLASYTFISWAYNAFVEHASGLLEFKKINNVFFDEFFTILIIVDVLLLLSSFFYSDKFHKVIRNSGFVISTILIKVSFLSEGIVNNLLIIGAVLFGYIILLIHNLYDDEKHL